MREFLLTASAIEIILASWVFFGIIYFAFGYINSLITLKFLPSIRYGKILDPRPIPAGQISREIKLSCITILLFGLGMVFPWGLLQIGWAELAENPRFFHILSEIFVMVIWNEIHFYINHRLLHTRLLQRFHTPHHRSVVTTPWSSYALHPIEALMLGNVLIVPMLLHDFSVQALLFVPIFSLIFNNIGHSNYDFKPGGEGPWREASRKHHLHHACYNGNFGFMFGFMDKIFGTALEPGAANKYIQRWRSRSLMQSSNASPRF